MTPKFSITNRILVDGQYVSNGHWALNKENQAVKTLLTKRSPALLHLENGRYTDRLVQTSQDPVDIARIIPTREGYAPLSECYLARVRSGIVLSYVYKGEGFYTAVDPIYVPILNLGIAYAKDTESPILVLDSKDLNGEFVGIVSPMRIGADLLGMLK